VLKMDAEIFPKNTFGGEVLFLNLLKWKNFTLQKDSKLAYKHIGEKKFIWLNQCVYKTALKCQKLGRKIAKNTSKPEPPSTWMLLSHSLILGLI